MTKQTEMMKINQDMKAFFKDLYKEEKLIVFGEGNLNTKIVLVGEAPGEQEVLQQRPFVGPAGKNLNEFLDILQLKREDIYITNAVKFRPFKLNPNTGRKSNRPPNREEIELSSPWLAKELSCIKPQVVVTLGNVSLRVVSGDWKINIGNVHGKPFPIVLPGAGKVECTLFPLYHPAGIIYRKELRSTYLQDLRVLKEYMEKYVNM